MVKKTQTYKFSFDNLVKVRSFIPRLGLQVQKQLLILGNAE